MPQCLEQTPQQLSNLTEGRSQSSVLSWRRGVKPRPVADFLPSRPARPSPTNAPGCPAHTRQWRPPSVLAGTSGVERTHRSQQLRTSGACPAAARVRPSESSWGGGGRRMLQQGGGRVDSKSGRGRAFLGAPQPRPWDQVAGPQSEAPAPPWVQLPCLGLWPATSTLPTSTPPGQVWAGTHRHAHTPPRPQSLGAAVVLDRKALFLLMK